jgi:hypothetical protein
MTTNEAITNVASIYNGNTLTTDKLVTTGSVTTQNMTVNNALTATTATVSDTATIKKLKIGNWIITEDQYGSLVFSRGDFITESKLGGSAFTFKNDGDMYINGNSNGKQIGLLTTALGNKINNNQIVEIVGRNGILWNWGTRCGQGDRDRDIGMGCHQKLGGVDDGAWKIVKK